jgi:hypothetical protein
VTTRAQQSPLIPALLSVLVSVYPALAVTATIPAELIRAEDLALPVGLTLLLTVLVWALAYALRRDAARAALAAVAVVIVASFLGAGPVAFAYHGDTDHSAILLVFASLGSLALGAVLTAILSSQRSLDRIAGFMTIWVSLLVGWNVVELVLHSLEGKTRAELSHSPSAPGMPDVYLIVLDKYTGSRMLSKSFGFDNGAMNESLRERGFVLPTDPRANYVLTFLALAAMLNVRYLDDLPARFTTEGRWEDAYPLIEHNRVVKEFRAQGYRIVTVPSAFGATRQNRAADAEVPAPSAVRSEVYARWIQWTAGPMLRTLACTALGCDPGTPPYLPSTAGFVDLAFRALDSLSHQAEQPKFVFAHLLLPHEPYLFGPHCEQRSAYWPQDDSDRTRIRTAYVDQIQCLNRRLLSLIDTIRARSRVPPVILLQGDHGHGQLGRDLPPLTAASAQAVAERQSVFAAYLLPSLPAGSISDSIGPVNIMRLVLRQYLHLDLPQLPEHTYWSSGYQPYHFTPIR